MKKFLFILIASLCADPRAQAGLKWSYRSTSNTQAYYATALRSMNILRTTTPWPLTSGGASVFGGKFLTVTASSAQTIFPALDNINIGTTEYAILLRLVPHSTGNPANNAGILQLGQAFASIICPAQGIGITITTSSKIQLTGGNQSNGCAYFNSVQFATAPVFTAGVATDLWIVWDGTTTSGHVELWQGINGSLPTKISTATASNAMQAPVLGVATEIAIGYTQIDSSVNQDFDYNEIAWFDTAINPSVAYGARTDFIPSPTGSAYEGYTHTNLSAGDVRSGISFGPGPGNLTGSMLVPSLANTAIGVAGDGGTGTFDGSSRWTCPIAGNLSAGVQLKCNSTTLNLTGTRQTVTNILESATLTGSSLSATLTAF